MKRYIRTTTITSSTKDLIQHGTLADFEQYIKEYDTDDWLRHSEAVRYDLDEVRKFLAIRDKYTYTEDDSNWDDWYEIDIGKGHHTKYGTNYVYVDPVHKLWRTKQNASEFYRSHHPEFNSEDWE